MELTGPSRKPLLACFLQGEVIFERLLSKIQSSAALTVRIAQNQPSEEQPQKDSEILRKAGNKILVISCLSQVLHAVGFVSFSHQR